MKNVLSNFRVVVILLLIAAIACLVLSKFMQGREIVGIFKITGLVFLGATILQLIAFVIYPAFYKNKKQVK